MTMTWQDWVVIAAPIAVLAFVALRTRRYTRSVADFMSASRVAGRYLATATS